MAFESLDPSRTINPTKLQAAKFEALANKAGFTMISLHEYYDRAQYPAGYTAQPTNVSGRDAYHRYLVECRHYVAQVPGVRIVVLPVETILIGSGNWHEVVLSIYPSHDAVVQISRLPGFADIVVHRDSGLKDCQTLAVNGDMNQLTPTYKSY